MTVSAEVLELSSSLPSVTTFIALSFSLVFPVLIEGEKKASTNKKEAHSHGLGMFPHPTAGCQYKPRPCPEWGDQRTEDRGIGPRGLNEPSPVGPHTSTTRPMKYDPSTRLTTPHALPRCSRRARATVRRQDESRAHSARISLEAHRYPGTPLVRRMLLVWVGHAGWCGAL